MPSCHHAVEHPTDLDGRYLRTPLGQNYDHQEFMDVIARPIDWDAALTRAASATS